MDRLTKQLLRDVKAARRFPVNTTPASRHVELIARELIATGKCHMINEEPEHCAQSILAVVRLLYERDFPAPPQGEQS